MHAWEWERWREKEIYKERDRACEKEKTPHTIAICSLCLCVKDCEKARSTHPTSIQRVLNAPHTHSHTHTAWYTQSLSPFLNKSSKLVHTPICSNWLHSVQQQHSDVSVRCHTHSARIRSTKNAHTQTMCVNFEDMKSPNSNSAFIKAFSTPVNVAHEPRGTIVTFV